MVNGVTIYRAIRDGQGAVMPNFQIDYAKFRKDQPNQ